MRSKPGEKRPRSDAAGEPDLVAAVRCCQGSPPFLSALRDLYGRADAALGRQAPACLGGGACCKFDLTDHRLYLSTGELALLALEAPPDPARCERGRCPYQVGPRCAARPRRPLGCRTFFCAAGLAERLHQTYETFHRRIRRLHAEHALPYRYVELTSAMGELVRAGGGGKSRVDLPLFFVLTGAPTIVSLTKEVKEVVGRHDSGR